jgi:hypothetical protein
LTPPANPIGHRLSAIGYRPSAIGYRLSAIGHRLLAIGYWLSAIGYRLLAIGYWLSAIGHRLLAIGHRLLAIGHRPSAIGYQLSAISYQLSAIGHRPSAIGYRPSAIGYRLLAIGHRLLAIGYQQSAIPVQFDGELHLQPIPLSTRFKADSIRLAGPRTLDPPIFLMLFHVISCCLRPFLQTRFVISCYFRAFSLFFRLGRRLNPNLQPGRIFFLGFTSTCLDSARLSRTVLANPIGYRQLAIGYSTQITTS